MGFFYLSRNFKCLAGLASTLHKLQMLFDIFVLYHILWRAKFYYKFEELCVHNDSYTCLLKKGDWILDHIWFVFIKHISYFNDVLQNIASTKQQICQPTENTFEVLHVKEKPKDRTNGSTINQYELKQKWLDKIQLILPNGRNKCDYK